MLQIDGQLLRGELSGCGTYEEAYIQLDVIAEGVSSVEVARVVGSYCRERALPLDSFGWQRRWRWFSKRSGPLSATSHTPENDRFKARTDFWRPKGLTIDRQCMRQATMVVFLIYVLNNQIYKSRAIRQD